MERWRAVDGWPYEVSDLGRVRRARPGPRTRVGRVRKLARLNTGYVVVNLSRDNEQWVASVHRLVATAFLDKPAAGCDVVHHIDNDRSNNRASNLEWTTTSQNIIHAVQGERWPKCKLTPEKVYELRAAYDAGAGASEFREMAKSLDVNAYAVYEAATRRTWGHLPER